MKTHLNLGCGDRFHPDWENVDFYPTGPNVRVHDLYKPLPYATGTFDAVYHSHILEHFPRQQAFSLLRECNRVLRPGGIIRVAVPDLERICRLYLETLEKASAGEPEWAENYEWMVMELFDQCVREETCGALTDYFRKNPNMDFVVQRWGSYVLPLRERLLAKASQDALPTRTAWQYVLRHPLTVLRYKLTKSLLSKTDREALQIGRFRRAGEVHMWMYDRFSLARLLETAGFTQPQRVGATESRIADWAGFNLDTEPDGRVYKADSMYMEAFKP